MDLVIRLREEDILVLLDSTSETSALVCRYCNRLDVDRTIGAKTNNVMLVFEIERISSPDLINIPKGIENKVRRRFNQALIRGSICNRNGCEKKYLEEFVSRLEKEGFQVADDATFESAEEALDKSGVDFTEDEIEVM